MEEICCIFCNIGSQNVLIKENGFQGRKCPQCGLIYISPRPIYNDIVNLYGHDEAHMSAQAHIERAFMKRIYARHNLRYITKFVRNGRLLEIGAGAGYFLVEAQQMGFEPYGIELNPIQAAFIRNKLGIPCVESPLDTGLFTSQRFDVVYHSDVVSHFYDPYAEFAKMSQVLKEGGFLVFETGNFGDIAEKFMKFPVAFYYPEHLFLFSTEKYSYTA